MVRSALVLADDCEARAAIAPDARNDFLERLAEAGFDARALDGSGIDLCERAGRSRARVVALEKLRFSARRRPASAPQR